MLINEKIEIKVNNKQVKWYQKLGYVFDKGGDVIFIENQHLPKNSGHKVNVKCDICGKEYQLTMQKYNKNVRRGNYLSCTNCNNVTFKSSMLKKYGEDNPSKVKKSIEKRKKTCLKKYNSEYVIISEHCKEKIKETFLKKYNGHPAQNKKIQEKRRKTRIKNGNQKDCSDTKKWINYSKLCRNKICTLKKQLLKMWDGFDYYDGEYIKENFKLSSYDPNYPTIDHKISISEGFKKNITIDEISNMENLCITKRKLNNIKNIKSEADFLNEINLLSQ